MNFLIVYDKIFVMMKYCKFCSVFGHRKIDITVELKKELFSVFKHLIEDENVSCFLFGGLGEFDELCHTVVTELKKKYPKIRRIFCSPDPRFQEERKRPNWLKKEDFEEIVFLDLKFDYWYTRIFFRNCEMINLSDFVVFFVKTKENSGAFKALCYAEKKKKNIINVFHDKENI